MFGYDAYVKTLNQIKKLDDRCKKCICELMTPNGYRMFSRMERKVIVSRDVFKKTKQERNKCTKAKIYIEDKDTQESEDIQNLKDIQELDDRDTEEENNFDDALNWIKK